MSKKDGLTALFQALRSMMKRVVEREGKKRLSDLERRKGMGETRETMPPYICPVVRICLTGVRNCQTNLEPVKQTLTTGHI